MGGKKVNNDWKSQLAAKYGVEKPEEKVTETNWAAESERYKASSRTNNQRNNYPKSGNNNVQRSGSNVSFGQNQGSTASAPYNFVSLPGMTVPSPLDQKLEWAQMDEKTRSEKYKEYIQAEGKLSGWLELDLETLTPCFIGGNGESFYAPNGVPVIPGSSLRGMIKNLLKIISCGAMRRNEDFYDWHLYFRDFAGRIKSLREHYKKSMVENVTFTTKEGKQETKPRTKASPGFLIRIKGKYFICPAQSKAIYDPKKCKKTEYTDNINWYKNGAVDIFTGKMNSKKTYMYIEKPDWSEENRIPVPPEVVEDYRADKNRKGLNLFEHAKTGSIAGGYVQQKEVDFVVPCYYTAQDGIVKHFGHGRYYRIAYDKSIGDHVPALMQGPAVDFADAMFGAKELWASRIFFDDAILTGKPEYLEKKLSHPLMSPNPTSFQLYLQQNGNTPKHWDNDTELRGYKLYWHQNIGKNEWEIGPDESVVSGMKPIQPLAKGNRFKGKIRFSNLSEIELGALCKVFRLSENGEDIVYKIGQGKSIGMGSVRIQAKLFLEDSKNRYGCLFQGDQWNVSVAEKETEPYCRKFISYMDEQLGSNRDRFQLGMKELRTIMNWKQTATTDWRNKTAMMNPTVKGDDRLKNRIVLKNALEFVTERFKK